MIYVFGMIVLSICIVLLILIYALCLLKVLIPCPVGAFAVEVALCSELARKLEI